MHEIIERGLKENDLRMFYRDARWQHAALLPAFRKIRALTRGEVEEEAGDAALKLLSDMTVNMPQLVELMGGVSLYEVEVLMEDHLRALVGWAIYSFVAAVEVRVCVLCNFYCHATPRRTTCTPTPHHTHTRPTPFAAEPRRRDADGVPAQRHACHDP